MPSVGRSDIALAMEPLAGWPLSGANFGNADDRTVDPLGVNEIAGIGPTGDCPVLRRELGIPAILDVPQACACTGRRKGAPSRLKAFIAAMAIVRSTRSLGSNAAAAAE